MSHTHWTGYKYFQFDIKTDTKNNKITELQIVVSDESGNRGKPSTWINSYDEQIEFAPWSGSKNATGVMYLDNLRLTKENNNKD